jgi:hypothetical protein
VVYTKINVDDSQVMIVTPCEDCGIFKDTLKKMNNKNDEDACMHLVHF